MTKRFLKADGWDEQTLFEYAKRHLVAAEILFENQDIKTYVLSVSSAGYLCHLGIELLLKGCWLGESGFFENEHNLHKLIKKISFLSLNDRLIVFLTNIEKFNEMRYPQDLSAVKVVEDSDINSNLPEEIGDHDWVGTMELLYEIQKQMPEDIQKVAQPIFANFENVLDEGKYLKNGKYLYRLVLDV
jgi:hypothetical protein